MNSSKITILAAIFIMFLGSACESQTELDINQSADYGIFDNSVTIGDVTEEGRFLYDPANQSYKITGTNSGNEEVMNYMWKAIQGNFIIRAVVEIGGDLSGQSELGWSVRNNIAPESEFVNASIDGSGAAFMNIREVRGGETGTYHLDVNEPNVIQLARYGNQFVMKAAKMGEPLQELDEFEVDLNNEIFAGLYVQSGDSNEFETVSFKNVRIVKPAPEDFDFYQDYLGSRMEVIDIETGNRTVLFETEHSFEAPNWHPNDQKLVFNSNGYLYNYDFETEKITHLNTGFAINNNNDHVITFDGTQIAISHHVPEDNNQSTIFILPIEGSNEPQQVSQTGAGHAFLHGISPDNQTVIFTGWRNDKYDIYAADVNTMEETQLTDTPYLDDGSEYSPDGEYIYFNSNRTGAMQIWRMRPDGSEQTQLTFDENFNDWFPHVSPDGKWIAFLSYGTDVESGDHPFYREVTLRLMPVEGGEPRIIAYLYGGQGTINVPSWSPDSRRFAFVSNSGRFY